MRMATEESATEMVRSFWGRTVTRGAGTWRGSGAAGAEPGESGRAQGSLSFSPRPWEAGNRSQTWDGKKVGWKREDIEKHSGVDAEDSGHDSAAGDMGCEGHPEVFGE